MYKFRFKVYFQVSRFYRASVTASARTNHVCICRLFVNYLSDKNIR